MQRDARLDEFARAMKSLENARFREVRRGLYSQIAGTLFVDEGIVPAIGVWCEITFGPNWDLSIPYIRCCERWMRKGDADWHCYDDYGLCVEVGRRWRDTLMPMNFSMNIYGMARFAAEYLTNSASWLIARHRFASLTGITQWPQNWRYWAHGDAGEREYLQTLTTPK